jgi:hypothetical protein
VFPFDIYRLVARRGVRRVVRAIVVAAFVGASITLAGPAAAATSASAPQACKSVSIFGLRGSGQTMDQSGGFGHEVGIVVQRLHAELADSGRPAALFPLDYTAASVDLLLPPSGGVNNVFKVRQYLASIDNGGNALYTAMGLRNRKCPGETFVVIGYSQGSMAIKVGLSSMAKRGERQLLSRIGGIGLIADPAKRANEYNVGSAAPRSEGVATNLGRGRTVPSSVAGTFASACQSRDVVCDFSKNGSVSVHKNYPDSVLADLAEALYPRVVRVSKPQF